MIAEQLEAFFNDITPAGQVYTLRIAGDLLHDESHRQDMAHEFDYYRYPHATMYTRFSQCRRQIAFDKLGWRKDTTTDAVGFLTMATGTLIECYLKAAMVQAGFDMEADLALEIPGWSSGGKAVCSRPDARIVVPESMQDQFGKLAVVEIKSINTIGFDYWRSVGVRASHPHYYQQGVLEMVAADVNTCVFLVQNKNSGVLHEEIIRMDCDATKEFDLLTDIFHYIETIQDPFEIGVAYGPEGIEVKHRGQKWADSYTGPNRIEKWFSSDGKFYGWIEVVGQKLPKQCQYCYWRGTCWEFDNYSLFPGFDDDGKPMVRIYRRDDGEESSC